MLTQQYAEASVAVAYPVGGTIVPLPQQAWLQPQAHPESSGGFFLGGSPIGSTELLWPEKITWVQCAPMAPGTTFASSNSPLSITLFPPTWKSKVGEGKAVSGRWRGRKGNEGVSGVIPEHAGLDGYPQPVAFVKGARSSGGRSRTTSR